MSWSVSFPSITLRLTGLCLAALLASGCATPWSGTEPVATHAGPGQCRSDLNRIDRVTRSAGLSDAETVRVDGYPYLRINRHLQSVGLSIATPRQARDWLERLRTLDRTARASELSNLPAATVQQLMIDDDPAPPIDKARQGLERRVEQCARQLLELEAGDPEHLARIRSRAVVPDNYSDLRRVVGLYPLTSLGVAAGVRRWERETIQAYQDFADVSVQAANLQRISVTVPRAGQSATEKLIASRRRDSLGIPVLTEQVQQWLLREFAPVFEIESQGDFDLSGALRFADDGQITIDSSAPTIYARLAYTRYGNESLIQLVYTVWFSERPTESAFDIYAGKLDGVMVRITLDPTGQPAVVDTIHPCGCYHQFFHTDRVTPRDRPAELPAREEWRFMPAPPLQAGPSDRLHVSIASATHYVRRMAFRQPDPTPSPAATLVPDRALTRLDRRGDASTVSLFDDTGLARGTERAERWILWPMGIDSAGAMRQWGTHATAFVGRRHFDDPDLIERRFRLR